MTEAENKSQFKPTKYTPCLALTGELWDVFCEDWGENWLHYNGTALYFSFANQTVLVHIKHFGKYSCSSLQNEILHQTFLDWHQPNDDPDIALWWQKLYCNYHWVKSNISAKDYRQSMHSFDALILHNGYEELQKYWIMHNRLVLAHVLIKTLFIIEWNRWTMSGSARSFSLIYHISKGWPLTLCGGTMAWYCSIHINQAPAA